MKYPLPKVLSLQQCTPEYVSIPEYRQQEIEPSGPFVFDLSNLTPAQKTALYAGVGILALAAVAFLLTKKKA